MFIVNTAHSETLPAPTRTIYKCKIGGTIAYTDEPCLGAQRLDAEPTRGVDKLSGRTMRGADVSREKRRELLAEAIRPLSGMNSQQYETAVRRQNLDLPTTTECKSLDQAIVRTENAERTAKANILPVVQHELLVQRKRYKELRC